MKKTASNRRKPIKAKAGDRPEPIAEIAKYLRAHAAAVYQMPVGEQFIGGRDVAFHSAMHQIADALEYLAKTVKR